MKDQGTPHEETSAEIASIASRILKMKEPRVVSLMEHRLLLKDAKRLAGSALTQRENHDG